MQQAGSGQCALGKEHRAHVMRCSAADMGVCMHKQSQPGALWTAVHSASSPDGGKPILPWETCMPLCCSFDRRGQALAYDTADRETRALTVLGLR